MSCSEAIDPKIFDIKSNDPARKAHGSFLPSPSCMCSWCGLIPGVQEAVVICLNKQTREAADHSLCVSSRRPPQILQDCKTQPCPPRYGKNWPTKPKSFFIYSLSKAVCELNSLSAVKRLEGVCFGEKTLAAGNGN